MHDHRFEISASPRWLTTLLLAAWLLALPAQAQEAAARVLHVAGQVYASSNDGDKRRLRRGDEIFPGDTLESARASSAQLVFSDNGRMAVRADTVVRVVDYRYDADNKENSSSFITLLGGAVRSITGFIGQFNKNKVLLTTPMVTIGIRGTDHETIYVQPRSATADDNAHAGTYNIVYSGATVLRAPGGELLLDRNDIGFVPGIADGSGAPVLIDALPRSVADMLALKIPKHVKLADLRAPESDRNPHGDSPQNGSGSSALPHEVPGNSLLAADQEIDATAPRRSLNFGVLKGRASATGVANSSSGMTKSLGNNGSNAAGVQASHGSSTRLPPGGGLTKPPKPTKPPRGNNKKK